MRKVILLASLIALIFYIVSCARAPSRISPNPPNTKSNQLPSIHQPGDQTNVLNEAVSLAIIAQDPDGDKLSFAAQDLPFGLKIDIGSGIIAGTPKQPGSYPVIITVSDGKGQSSATFNWSIQDLSSNNRAPTITHPGDQSYFVGDSPALKLSAQDPEGDKLVFSATGLPHGITLSSEGLFEGTLLSEGIYQSIVRVTDFNLESSITLFWKISRNTPPLLKNPGSQESLLNETISLRLEASDQENNSLSFSASDLPKGLTINADTGEISGQPNALGTYQVTTSVMDAYGQTDETFTWNILATGEPAIPIAYWKFDETNGLKVVDSSGFGNHGTLSAAQRVTGKVGSALYMTNSRVSIPLSTSLAQTAEAITLLAWVKRDNLNNAVIINHAYPDLFFGFHGEKFKWQFRNSEGNYAACYAGISPLDTWLHMAGTYDGKTAKLYVNGKEICSVNHTGFIPMMPSPFTLGSIPLKNDSNGDALSGYLDEVKIYDKALSGVQILEVYRTTQ